MNFFTQFKCALCPRWSCHARYQIGNRTYYSGLGFVSTQCPKKIAKITFYDGDDEIKEESLKKVRGRNNHNDKKGE